jgi:hypothetical protein
MLKSIMISQEPMMHIAHKPSVECWQTIKLAYLAGGDTAGLAEQHGITESCLRKRITRQGWAMEKHQLAQTVTEHTVQTCESAARKFKQQMCGEFDEWFRLAARQRGKINDGDFAAFNDVVNAFTKLHAAAFKHHGLENKPELAVIIGGLHTGVAEPEEAEVIDIE